MGTIISRKQGNVKRSSTRILKYTTFAKYLPGLTVMYLSFPVGLFFLGWLRIPLAVGLILLFAFALYLSLKSLWQLQETREVHDDSSISLSRLLLCLLPGIVLIMISGAGGWGFQDSDWLKHNAILHDVMSNSWPVMYNTAVGPVMLVYYIAYYLPAAYVGKVFGWQIANHVLFLSTLIGVLLSILWVLLLTQAKPLLCGAVFVIFSGMDILGNIIVNASKWDHIEAWSGIGQYSSNVALLFWVPQQAIPGWLITALLLYCAWNNRLHHSWIFYIALSCLWAPFITIGLIPLSVGILLLNYFKSRYSIRDMASWINIAGIVFGVVFVLYFLARFHSHPLLPYISGLSQSDFMVNIHQDNFFVIYLLFITLEFFLLSGILLYTHFKKKILSDDEMWLLVLVTSILLILPFFKYGHFNDLVMRASIPSLFVLLILTIKTIQRLGYKVFTTVVIFWLLFIGSLTVTIELRRHIDVIFYRRHLVVIPEQKKVLNLFQLQHYIYRQFNFIGQYVGSVDSFFGRYLAKKIN